MSKPTPTQSEVRCAYSVAMYDIADDKERAEAYLLDQYEAAFDRWLAERDAKVRAEALREVRDAWVIPGRVPTHHHRMRVQLRRDWPVLAGALDRIEREERA